MPDPDIGSKYWDRPTPPRKLSPWWLIILIMLMVLMIISLVFLFIEEARAETMVIERVVPSNATLTYAVDGVSVHTVQVPEGRVRVTIEYKGSIHPNHGPRRRME